MGQTAQTGTGTPSKTRAPIRRWLIIYNILSLALWATCLVGAAIKVSDVYNDHKRAGSLVLFGPVRRLLGRRSPQAAARSGADYSCFDEVGAFVLRTQSLAILEVIHVILGWVRASLVATLVQVSSRLLLVGVCHALPNIAGGTVTYTTMVLAWSVTEVVRYSAYAANLAGQQLFILNWLRYNLFLILYPLGAGSEFVIMLQATSSGAIRAKFGTLAALICWLILAIYPPGLYVLYSHMLRQRRKFYAHANDSRQKKDRRPVGVGL